MTRITGNLYEHHYAFVIILAQFFLERKMSQTKFIEKIRISHLILIKFFFKYRAVYDNADKYCTA